MKLPCAVIVPTAIWERGPARERSYRQILIRLVCHLPVFLSGSAASAAGFVAPLLPGYLGGV